MEDLVSFARLLEALRPWLSHLVIVGGWAHRLHRLHPLASTQVYQPLLTRDVDLAFSPTSQLDGDICQALARAGFKEELLGEFTPPITHYRLGDVDAGFYAEFLTPKRGSGHRRDGHPDLTVSKAGITAQRLRHLDLLLESPWSVRTDGGEILPVDLPFELIMPNPVSFIVQKLLIHKRRPPEKQAQDILYIHDTLELFGESLDNLRSLWNQLQKRIPHRTAKRAVATATVLFASTSDSIREAARIPQDRRLSPSVIRAATEFGLNEIFQVNTNQLDNGL